MSLQFVFGNLYCTRGVQPLVRVPPMPRNRIWSLAYHVTKPAADTTVATNSAVCRVLRVSASPRPREHSLRCSSKREQACVVRSVRRGAVRAERADGAARVHSGVRQLASTTGRRCTAPVGAVRSPRSPSGAADNPRRVNRRTDEPARDDECRRQPIDNRKFRQAGPTGRAHCLCWSVRAVARGFEPREESPPHTLSRSGTRRSAMLATVLTRHTNRERYLGGRPRMATNETKTETNWPYVDDPHDL